MSNITKVTGYQWGDNGAYIGPYVFDVVGDVPHVPPNTTIVAPPSAMAAGKEAAWDGAAWVVRNKDLGWME